MPVYLFTDHAYQSWMPDHRRGYTKEGERYQPPNLDLARAYRDAASFPPFEFDRGVQRFLLEVAHDVCGRRQWRLHAASTEPTHVHALVSWRPRAAWQDVRGKIKNILSLELSKRSGEFGRRWFSEKASRKHVVDREHFDYLVKTYLFVHSGWRGDEQRGWTQPRSNTRSVAKRTPDAKRTPEPDSLATPGSPARKGGVPGRSEETRRGIEPNADDRPAPSTPNGSTTQSSKASPSTDRLTDVA